MTDFQRTSARLVLLVFMVAACGGGGGTTSAAPDAAASSAPSQAATSEAPASGAPEATPSETASGAGGTAAGVCELVTADELAGIFGVASVTATVLAGPPDNCIVSSAAGDPLTAWSLSTAQAKVTFDALTGDPSAVEVTGIGDKAAIVQNTGLLVLKGDALVVISISGGSGLSEEEAVEVSKRIATLAAGRM